MADHYGDAELVIGQHHTTSADQITAFTKWCPSENGVKTFEQAEAAIDRALRRMNQEQIVLLQYHIWNYSDDTYLHNLAHLRTLQQRGKIRHIGLTNVDAAHLELLLHSGFEIATNQVSCSVIDRRLVEGRLSTLCAENGVGILAYGTLLGGFLSEKWLGKDEPEDLEGLNLEPAEVPPLHTGGRRLGSVPESFAQLSFHCKEARRIDCGGSYAMGS